MKEIFELLTSAKTPLAIAGGFAAILFFIISQILNNKDKSWKIDNKVLLTIINRLFALALIALVLGFLGFIFPLPKESNPSTSQAKNISFNIFDKKNKVALKSVLVNIMNINASTFLSNHNGLVSLNFLNPDNVDSLLLEFQSTELGIQETKKIPVENFTKELYLEVNNQIEITREIKSDVPKSSSQKPKILTENSEFTLRIKSILFKIGFNSSINDVYAFEFGSSFTGNIEYEKLPVATECTEKLIRYYWRYIDQSKIGVEVHAFLRAKNLESFITSDSYLVYYFIENKLIRINLRLVPNENSFDNLFSKVLTEGTSLKAINYNKVKAGEYYYITGSSFKDIHYYDLKASDIHQEF